MIRDKFSLIVCIFFLSSLLSTCLFIPFSHAEELKIGGAGSALGSMKLLAAAFEKKNPGTKVTVLASLGSIGGIKAVSKGALDIGLTGRPLDEKERELNLAVTEYAKTPVVFVTRKNVNVEDLTEQEIVKIFEGKTEKRPWPCHSLFHSQETSRTHCCRISGRQRDNLFSLYSLVQGYEGTC